MKRFLLLLLGYLLSLSTIKAQNPGDLDLTFTNSDFLYDYVGEPDIATISSFDFQNDGKIVLAGNLSRVNGINIEPLFRLNPDGTFDSGFTPPDFPNWSWTRIVKVLPDGKILVAGHSTAFGQISPVNGSPRGGLIRLNPNGTLDTSFPAGTGVNGVVTDIKMQGDKIIIVGGFSQINGVPMAKIARFNSDGSLDPSFTRPETISGTIEKIEIQSDGKIILAGSNIFSSNQGIARLNPDGSVDTSFSTSQTANFSLASDIQILDDGKIIVGASEYQNRALPIPARKLVRFNPDGSFDSSFSLGVNPIFVTSFLKLSNGKIVVAGRFASTAGGTSLGDLILLNSDGSYDPSVNFGATTDRGIVSIASLSGNKFLISGSFTSYKGVTVEAIARIQGIPLEEGDTTPPVPNTVTLAAIQSQCGINSDELIAPTATDAVDGMVTGTTDLSIFPLNQVGSTLITWTYSDAAGNESTQTQEIIITGNNQGLGEVDCTLDFKYLYSEGGGSISPAFNSTGLVEEDGRFYVGGVFNRFDGVEVGNIARFFPDGTRDESFNAVTDAQVYVIVRQEDGKLLLGGAFSQVNGQPINRIVRLNPDGSIDNSFNSGTGFNALVRNIAVQKDGKIIVIGGFDTYNGSPINVIVRLNSDGSLDNGFVPEVRFYGNPLALGVQEDGKIIFAASDVSASGPRKIIRLNPNGSIDRSLFTSIGNSTIWDLVIQNDGKIVLPGVTSFNGSATNGNIIRLNRDGSLDTSFNPGSGFGPGLIRTIYSRPDRGLFAAGNITSYQGQPANSIVAINSDGSLDTRYDFGTGVNSGANVADQIQQTDGKILAIGNFTSFDGEKRIGAVRIHGVLDEEPPLSDFEEDISQFLPLEGLGRAAWGDIDNDGDMDMIVAQVTGGKIFINDGIGKFTGTPIGFPPIAGAASITLVDMDQDGDLDVFLAGNNSSGGTINKVFMNDGTGQFSDAGSLTLGNVFSPSVSWGDYDNDGDKDLLLLGDLDWFDDFSDLRIPTTQIYRNEGNLLFTKLEENELSETGIHQLYNGAVNWVDYNQDGNLDFVISGFKISETDPYSSASAPATFIYKNSGNGKFEKLNVNLIGVRNGSLDWADYDKDGDLDLLISGLVINTAARIYRNDGNDSFTEINLAFDGVNGGFARWGDYDNDGDPDILISGTSFQGFSNANRITKVFKNQAGTFLEINVQLPGISLATGGWADLDGDGDLDFMVSGFGFANVPALKVFKNNHVEKGGNINYNPTAPINLVSTPNPAEQKMRFEWEEASDVETPTNSLSYNLYIREVGSVTYSKTPEALESDGWRLLPGLGNASLNPFSEWNYSEADKGKTFEWSVQAIDGAFEGGEFAESGFFTLDNTPPTLINKSGTFDTDASRPFNLADLSADDDETPADQLVFTIKSMPVAGTLTFDGAAVEIGQIFTQADIATGKLSYQNTMNTARTDSFTFSVRDLFLNETDVETFSITMNDVTPPVAIGQAMTVILDANGFGAITPEQINNGSTDNFTGPENLLLALDRLTFGCADVGVNPQVQLTVKDENGNSSTASATVTVLDQPPPIVATKNITLRIGANGTITLTPAAIDRGTRDACGIASLSINVTQFTCADLGTREVILTATDVNGNTAYAPALVTIEDATAPTFSSSLPKSISVTLAEGEPYVIPDFSGFVIDNCGVSSYSQSILAGTVYFTAGTYNVNINVSDASGNTAKATVKIVRSAPKVKEKGVRLTFENPELMTVPWNTPIEEVLSGLEWEENLALSWIADGYDRLTPGMYQVKALSTPQIQARFNSTPVLNILIQDKPLATDIQALNSKFTSELRVGSIVADLKTIDPVDNIHTYQLEENSLVELRDNQLIWKGGAVPAQLTLKVYSMDRAGQSISKEITLTKELRIGEFLIYPNPAENQTQVLVELDRPAEVTLRVFDAAGRLVITDQFTREETFVQTLDLRGMAAGLYTVQVQIGDLVMTGRLIKK